MSFKPSVYQQAVYDHITNGKGNAVIDAVAGSGKSTTIVNALKLIPKTARVLFLAFNKAIVEELKIKVGELDNVDIRTLHSLGSSVIRKAFRTNLDGSKYRSYINQMVKFGSIKPNKELEWEEMGSYKSNIHKLVDIARVNLCETNEQLFDLARKHNLWIFDNEIEMAFRVIDWGKNNIGTHDFTDMIYLPNVLKLDAHVQHFDYVFIDECQDLNACQRELFLKTIQPVTGRFVAVGDPRQAIYGFAGADVQSFELLKAIPNTTLLPLSVCYRCDNTIINLAKEIVPQIEARDNAENGVVDYEAKVEDVKDGDMILCRITAPLVAQCMNYISNSIKAFVKGRDIGQNLINMINNTKRRYLNETLAKLDADLAKLADKIMSKTGCDLEEAKQEDTYVVMADKINAIRVIAKDLKTTDAVINRINQIFKDESREGICLSTIHKAKGLESDRVFILRPDKLYLKHCMAVEWMAEQEHNLVYVAYTRAKHYLGFLPRKED